MFRDVVTVKCRYQARSVRVICERSGYCSRWDEDFNSGYEA